jgi:hypothetical protein
LRIILKIEVPQIEEAGIILETIGFEPDEDLPIPEPKDGLVDIVGELPESRLGELESVIGLRNWEIAPLETPTSFLGRQAPETD